MLPKASHIFGASRKLVVIRTVKVLGICGTKLLADILNFICGGGFFSCVFLFFLEPMTDN